MSNARSVVSTMFRRAAAAVLLRVFRVTVDRRVLTREAIRRGSCVLACNHQSFLDGVLLALTSPQPLVFTCEPLYAKTTWWSRVVLDLLTWFGYGWVIPLGRDNPMALRQILKAVRAGRSVVLFPEGRISPDGIEGPSLPGIEWLRSHLGCPVIELRIEGAHRSKIFAKRGDQWWPAIRIRF